MSATGYMLAKHVENASSEPDMNLAPIHLALGEDTPHLTPTPLGRLRLLNALKNKFGANFRNIPAASGALSHFDSEHKFFESYRRIKGAKNA